MPRKFYYKNVTIKHNKMYGYNTQEVSVYYLDQTGQPHLIDRFTYHTGSTPGPEQEIVDYLTSHAYGKGYFIPKKYHGKKYWEDNIYKTYRIFEMF